MAENTMKVKIMSPERVFYEGEATFIEFNTTAGMRGIYPKHVPTTMVIQPGILKIVEPEGDKQAALHTGFVEVLQDSIIMLAESVEWPEEIDEKRAEEAKIRAERRINDDTQDHNRAELALKRAVLRLQMCKK
ncbi:MAG: ATP synthase F1 subunit epsilon [Lachnospiraceae bacterium]|nr:ATP synthase F1 subunit epsilon [Lachnospiraceae bacterium]